MILINMATGRSPWRQAVCSDAGFTSFLRHPDFLRSMLPLSAGAAALARRILAPNPAERPSIADIRAGGEREHAAQEARDELARASRHVRDTAKAYLKLSLAAAPLAALQPDGAITTVPLLAQAHIAPARRPLPRPPVTATAASSASNTPSMLRATLGASPTASSRGPITPETRAVADTVVAVAQDAIDELALPQPGAPLRKPAAAVKTSEEHDADVLRLRQAIRNINLNMNMNR
jgi:hypothetical protein